MLSVKSQQVIKVPKMLLIGAAASNVGKTTFACRVIENVSRDIPLVAVKVTTISERDGRCPRGGEGCGVCSSFEGTFTITEETSEASDKDTSKLLAAGAKKVYWLRTLKEYLAEGAAALVELIGHDAVCVCESNSLRHVVEPGVFVIVSKAEEKVSDPFFGFKDSARVVGGYADRIVCFDGEDFDIDPADVCFGGDQWSIKGQSE